MTRDEIAGVIIRRVIEREGGIKDVDDGKGVTSFGQTPAWLHDFKLPAPTTPEQAADNYRRWLYATGLIVVCDAQVTDTLADVVIDWSVMSGHQLAIRALQEAVGVQVDGVIGPTTTAALARLQQTSDGRRHAAERVLASAIRFAGHLITHAPTNARYAEGWLTRRAAQIADLT